MSREGLTPTRDTGSAGRRAGKIAGSAVATMAVLLAAAGASYGVLGLSKATDSALRDRGASAPVGRTPSEPAVPVAPVTPTTEPTPTLTPAPEPEPVLEPGDSGVEVRELQARLAQLAWFNPMTTGTYGPGTRAAVRGFQSKRGFEVTGVVDERTWRRLVRMTSAPTKAELFNRPGPTLFGPGDSGPQVREIQARLRQIGWYFGNVTSRYGAPAREAVVGFQGKRGIPQTGEVDQRTLDLLEGMTVEPTADELANRKPDPADGAPLDPRCTTGVALCIDKSSSSLRFVVNGDVRVSLDVRFGSSELPTREGQFSVYRKSRDHVSSLYNTSMPFAMFFSGGQAVHYSPDFAANGYNGASHGCVNVRDYAEIAALYDQVPLGTKVIVYWS